MSDDPTVSGRPHGPSYDLPLHAVRVTLGSKLRPDALMHGYYESEYNWYRSRIIRGLVEHYADWTVKNNNQSGSRLNEGHKREMRAILALLDSSYEAEVVGVRLISDQCSTHKANQCYLGDPQAGPCGGSSAYYRVMFRGSEPDTRPGREDLFNHVAYEPDVWFQGSVVERAAKLNNARFNPLVNLRGYSEPHGIGMWVIRGNTVTVPASELNNNFSRSDAEEKSVFAALKRKLGSRD